MLSLLKLTARVKNCFHLGISVVDHALDGNFLNNEKITVKIALNKIIMFEYSNYFQKFLIKLSYQLMELIFFRLNRGLTSSSVLSRGI